MAKRESGTRREGTALTEAARSAGAANLETLRERAQWYLEGCPHLDDHGAYLSNGLAGDAGADLMAALQMVVRPRVHGNGFIQVDLTPQIRLHVWGHPDIPKQQVPAQVHDHTFGFRSRILIGGLRHVSYRTTEDAQGTHSVYQARVRQGEDRVLENTGKRVFLAAEMTLMLRAGEGYDMAAGEFHESQPQGPTATIITKTGPSLAQGGPSPRVLVKVGETPDNEFNRYALQPDALWRIIGEVLAGEW